jgi:hypothetical protein
MLRRASKKPGFARRDSVFLGEFSWIIKPHEPVAIKAATGLAGKSAIATTGQRARHRRSPIVK